MQKSYWNMMTEKKYELLYLNMHFGQCTKIDRGMNIFLAIASSTAIAGWAIWQQLGFILAIVVAASQVLTVIKSHLPYKKRMKEINELITRLTPIYIEIEYQWHEYQWHNVAEGELTESEINNLYYSQIKEWANVEKNFFTDDSIPMNDSLQDKAEKLNKLYFNNLYYGGDENE